MAATSTERSKYWQFWIQYCGVDSTSPIFTGLSQPILRRLKGFAARVRTGYYGKGRQIKVATVQVALSAIGTSLVVAGHSIHNPLHDASGKLVLPLRYLLDAYGKRDPPVLPQLAVPLEVIINAQKILPQRGKQYQRAALLIGVAYLYLLRVGECTKPRRQTRTVQFRLKDVLF